MSAPTGNKRAERWTRDLTIQYIIKIERYISSSDVIYLGHALTEVGLYSDIWSYWRQKWEDDYEIYDRMMLIMQRFENRIFMAALHRDVHAGVAMFALKVHYGWTMPKPVQEMPPPAPSAPLPPVPEAEPESAPNSVPKESKPLVMKTFTNTGHLIPTTSYCGLPTFMEAGEPGAWVKCGEHEYFKIAT